MSLEVLVADGLFVVILATSCLMFVLLSTVFDELLHVQAQVKDTDESEGGLSSGDFVRVL